jgi:hypothetical protein
MLPPSLQVSGGPLVAAPESPTANVRAKGRAVRAVRALEGLGQSGTGGTRGRQDDEPVHGPAVVSPLRSERVRAEDYVTETETTYMRMRSLQLTSRLRVSEMRERERKREREREGEREKERERETEGEREREIERDGFLTCNPTCLLTQCFTGA